MKGPQPNPQPPPRAPSARGEAAAWESRGPRALTPAGPAGLEHLLAGICAGQDAALDEFYERTSPLVFSLLQRLLHNAQAAEEVCMEVFEQVWRKAHQFDPGRGRAASWLMTMTRSRALDELRRRRTRGANALPLSAEPLAATGEPEPLARLADASETRHLQRALERLPDSQRLAVELAFLHGLSHTQIAKRLGEPLGTIKTRVRLGLAALRPLLQSSHNE